MTAAQLWRLVEASRRELADLETAYTASARPGGAARQVLATARARQAMLEAELNNREPNVRKR